MWTLIVFTIVSTSTYDYSRVTEIHNLKDRGACNAQKKLYESRNAFNFGYCEKQVEKIKPNYQSEETRKPV